MELPDEDTIRILITTDNHVGYNENDPITGNDSWKTFHEVMMIAKDYQVDMVLQSGDLFHVNKPSKKSMYQVMRSLRLACMGDKPCELELLSDSSRVFNYSDFTNVNYEDPNFNISIPMFAISGNHDDATGDNLLCPMDILHVSGLVNHYGKVLETDKIKLSPLLFQKGKTKLALYGLQSIREERLFRTFKEGGITFEVPTVRDGEWFNLMCVHQNHTGHTNTAFLPEQFLPGFLDMVVWGHEHECIPNLVYNPTRDFNVLQPGSSVATSLCDAEAKPKYVFILEINYKQDKKQPKLIPVPLNTIRTFKMKNIALNEVSFLNPHDKDAITKYLTEQVDEMINEANEETKEKMRQNGIEIDEESEAEGDFISNIPLPLIRLRVNYSGPTDSKNGIKSKTIVNDMLDYQVENPRRFSNKFVGRVANSNNIVQYYKKKKPTANRSAKPDNSELQSSIMQNDDSNNGEFQIEMLVNDMLNKMQLSLLPEVGFNNAIKKFVEKDEKTALKEFIDKELSTEVEMLVSSKQFVDKDDSNDIKLLLKEVKRANTSTPRDTSSSSIPQDGPTEKPTTHKSDDIIVSSDDGEVEESPKTSHRTRKSITSANSPKKVSRARKTKAVARSSPDSIIISDSDDDMLSHDEDEIVAGDSDMSEDEEYVKPKTTRKKSSANPKSSTSGRKHVSTAGSRSKTTTTPRTNLLESFLAKKRR